MQITQHNSNKYLQNTISDPLINILRQLRDLDAEEGDYIKIIEKENFFQPIYKITYLQERKAKEQPIRKSLFRDSSHDIRINQQKLHSENQEKIRLSFGSQIYLKYNNLLNAKIALIKPKFPNLFIQLRIKGKGLIHCIDGKIIINNFQKTESIWMCISSIVQQSRMIQEEESKSEVIFCNFVQNQYLYIDNNGIMTVCPEQRATRFNLRQIGNSDTYVLEGRNVLSQMIRNKSKEQIKRIIDRSIERNEGSKTSFEIQLQIMPVEDTMITIHLELNYSKKALERQASLKLTKLILKELIYYDILDFLRDDSILSEHIQELLIEYQILKLIEKHLEKYFEYKCNNESPFLVLPKKLTNERSSSKFQRHSSKEDYDESLIEQVLKVIGLLCRQNIQISKIFIELLDQLIMKELYHFAELLLENNQYFLSQFHKANWYSHLYRIICRSSKQDVSQVVNFLCFFCKSEKELSLSDSAIQYRSKPSTSNQYLLYHSLRTGDIFGRIFRYELYIEGIYVFVHDTKTGKDIQFNTFIQGTSANESSNPIKDRSSIKIELQQSVNQQSSHKQQDVQLLLSQLKLLRALIYNYNPNIIQSIWNVIYGLAPYCYKENFPQIQNYQVKSIIFQLMVELEPFHKEAKLLSTFLISCSLVDSDNFGRNSMNQEQSKIGVSNFIKNNKKKTQTSRKILKQMGNYFLKKGKDWSESIRKKTLQISQICNNQQEHLSSWLEIMVQALTMRLFKVKEKKQALPLRYIKKLFQAIEDKKGVIEIEGNMMNEFMELLLEIVKNHSKYDKYLQQIKAKRYYDGKSNQINKVISNLQGKKEVSFIRNQKGLTKIELIDLVHRGLSQEQGNIRQSARKQIQILNNEQFQNIKLTSLRLIQLMVLNVNEEMIDEAVDTLAYLIKNPSTISSLSSFTLLDLVPKYPYENLIKRIVLQQWYLSSNCHQLNELLQILRLIYTKHMIYRRNINNVLLIDNEPTFKAFQTIVSPAKFLKRVASHCESWLRPSLLDKYPDIYMGVDKNLQIIIDCLQKLSDRKSEAQIANLIQNIELVDVLSRYIQYISAYYLEQQTQNAVQKSRLFHMKSEINFVQLKLSPLAEKIIKILQIYTKGSGIQRAKFVMFTFGEILSSVHSFSIVLIQIIKENIDSSQQNLLQLLQSVSPSIIYNFSLNFKTTWKFFQFYLYLQGQDLLREVNSLYRNAICKFDELQQQKFVVTFLNSCIGKNSSEILVKSQLIEDKYDFGHQIVIMKIVLKLLYNSFLVDFVYWFKDKVFWHLIQSLAKNNSQNYYMLELTNEQIKRRQMVAQLAFYFKGMSASQAGSVLRDKEEHDEDYNHLVIDFILEEHQLSKLYIDLQKSNHQNIRKISDSAYIQYLQYLICDVTMLAYSINFLNVGKLFDDFYQYFVKLKDIYKRRVSYKSNDDTFTHFTNAERIFWRDPNFKLEGKLRTVKFDKLDNSSASNSRSEAKIQIKPLRKWAKAVAELNKQKFLSKNPEFIEDMLAYEQIYELKNESEEINLVINHNDIFLKLLEVSLNMRRLKLSVQNQIFVLENILLLSKSRHKKKKELDEGLVSYGNRVLEMLLEEQRIEANFDRQASIISYQKWKTNTYVLALILRIIQYSRCLQSERTWRQYLHYLLSFLEQSIANYQSDITFMQLYLSTIHSNEEIQHFDIIIPFQTILSIFTKQIIVENMSEEDQMTFGGSVLKAYLSFNQTLEYDFRKYKSSELMKIIDGIDKAILTRVQSELNEDLYYRCLINIKK